MDSAAVTSTRSALDALLSLLAPSLCVACDAPRRDLGGGGVCPRCWADASAVDDGPRCAHCALPGRSPCAWCERHAPHPIHDARALGVYAGPLERIVVAFKFHGFDLLAAPAAERLARRIAAVGESEIVVPVPSTPRRNRDRGYDPAALLARELAFFFGRRSESPLTRARDSAPQSSLPASARFSNVSGAFRARSRGVKGRHILLVDDVVTTGATAFHAASALRDAGASSIRLAVLARTPTPHTSMIATARRSRPEPP